MADRFFCADLSGPVATLSESEAHHAIHVMRVSPGQPLELFDGAGSSAVTTVTKLTRNSVSLRIVTRSFVPKPDTGLVTLAVVPPKGDRLRWMLEKLTEIGVDRFIPLRSERGVVDPRPARLEKLATTVINAAKQCGAHWLMELAAPLHFRELLEAAEGQPVFVAHPGQTCRTDAMMGPGAAHCIIVIGPEGGFTNDEVSLAGQRGAQLISWNGHILRTETAAVVFATLARCRDC